jgi:hypothetical protein
MDKTTFPLINDIFLCAMIGGPIKRYGKQNKYDIGETVIMQWFLTRGTVQQQTDYFITWSIPPWWTTSPRVLSAETSVF